MKIKDFQDTRNTKFSGVPEIQRISEHAKNLRFLCMKKRGFLCMKKRGIFSVLLLIFLLILMPNSFSIYEELVYSGTVEDRDSIEIANSIFEFRIDSVSNKVFIEIDISGIIIESGGCKIKDNFDICISNISFSYRNITDYYEVYKTNVIVYQIKSKLDIKNTIIKNNILLNEDTSAELIIENTADIVAEDVTATIDIPSSVLVSNIEGCKKIFNTLVFQADVHPKQIKKCSYNIQGISPDDFELTANVSYFDGIDQINTTSSTISVKVYNYSLQITPKLNKSKLNIGEKLNLTVNIENINDQYDIRITTLNIKLPEKLLLIKRPKDTTGNNRVISWSGTLAPNENRSFIIEFQSFITGNYSVQIEASYKIDKFLRKAEESANIVVYCDCPYITHDFSQQIVGPEQNVRLSAFLINPSKVNRFRNVDINYFSDIPGIQDYSTLYSEIKPLETIKIFDSSIITPPLEEIYHLNIESSYKSSSNQVFVVRDNIIIKIPSVEEEIDEEQSEEQQQVSLDTNKTRAINETEKNGSNVEIPVTTLEDGNGSPIKLFTIIVFIATIIFVLVILIIFQRKRNEKKEYLERNAGYQRKEEPGYEDLEKQVRGLGNIFEEKKQVKTRLFGNIFRKK